MYDGVGGAAYWTGTGLAVRKFDEVTDRGAKAVKALYGVLDVLLFADGNAGLEESSGALAAEGGRGGREEGGC